MKKVASIKVLVLSWFILILDFDGETRQSIPYWCSIESYTGGSQAWAQSKISEFQKPHKLVVETQPKYTLRLIEWWYFSISK